MKYASSHLTGLVVTVFLAGLFLAFPAAAQMGQESSSWTCSGEGTLNSIFCGITSQFRWMPKTLSTFSYVLAVILFVSGLLQLKEYGDDPSKTPLRGIMIKLALGTMLISLPFMTQIFVTTVTGADDMATATISVSKPTLGSGVSGTN